MIHDVHNIDRAVKYYTALTPHTVPHMEPLILHLSCTTSHTSEMSGISPCYHMRHQCECTSSTTYFRWSLSQKKFKFQKCNCLSKKIV